MDIKKYIESGVLEHYLLGLLSESEAREVERLASEYPEIRKELDSLEVSLENFAQANATKMPEGLTDKILNKINEQSTTKPKISADRKAQLWWAIFAFVLFAVATKFFLENRELKQNLEQIQIEKDSLEQNLNSTQRDLEICNAGQKVIMRGTNKEPRAIASVLYNPENQTATLEVIDMPDPPSGKQYQLWALVDGTPIDMGVFDVQSDQNTPQSVPFIENADGFAVTLEPSGGSLNPTLSEMVVIGTP